ncbi:MAG: transglycosylase family protein [Acidimicrobiales bacterium]|nr:transglycosylase family protein [Acidimicrobiales bacterium]
MTTIFRRVLLLVGVTLVLSACTPDQFRAWLASRGINPNQFSQQQIDQGAAAATALWQAALAEWADLIKYDHILSDASLARLRQCESGGNYAAVSPGGAYRGAYQFARTTWNSVASRHYPKYVGVDPAAAAPKVQDSMARALYLEMGRSPWPVCGRYL